MTGEIISVSTYTLPFAHLNLRRNPFGEFSAEEWTALADVEVEEFDEFLREPGSVVQFLGEKGSARRLTCWPSGRGFPVPLTCTFPRENVLRFRMGIRR